MKAHFIFGLVLLAFLARAEATSPTPSVVLMPVPAQLVVHDGEFIGTPSFSVDLQGHTEPRLTHARDRFLAQLQARTGVSLRRRARHGGAQLVIRTAGASAPVQLVREDESYKLEVTAQQITLDAATPLGVLHGLQTLLQLVQKSSDGFTIAAVTINDQPRFAWRGLMIDAARHFQPIDVIKRNLDGMEAVKLNVFHWHLSDNQGFRVESSKFPLLQGKGSDGNYYTRAQVQDLISYARERGIRVIPEFDMPGHTSAWFVGYPFLAANPGPQTIERRWGVFDPAMDPSQEATFTFLDTLIGEMSALFPDAYFHIGGDECNGKAWDQNVAVQKFMKAQGLRTDEQLQAYFTNRVQALVVKHGKIPEGWDEVLQPNTSTNVVIQSWRGTQALAEAAHRGNQGLLSNGYYIDLNLSAAEHYAVDPIGKEAAALPIDEQKRILGGEATMWSEFTDPNNIDSRIWPRTAAIAERLWSPASVRDVDSMYQRLAVISYRLEILGLKHNSNYLATLTNLVGAEAAPVLKTLGDVMQPPEQYVRGTLADYTQFSILNHLVDGIHPESDIARSFATLATRIASGTATTDDFKRAKDWLQRWVDNDALLQPSLSRSALAKELISVSETLRDSAKLGLDALTYLQSKQPAPKGWQVRAVSALEQAAKPQAAMIDKIAPSVELLVKAVQ